jgi:hypothetical protein
MNIKAIISESGKILQLFNADTGCMIAEILVHGFLNRAMDMSAMEGNYIFRGELFQLAGWEFLNINEELISERISS